MVRFYKFKRPNGLEFHWQSKYNIYIEYRLIQLDLRNILNMCSWSNPKQHLLPSKLLRQVHHIWCKRTSVPLCKEWYQWLKEKATF